MRALTLTVILSAGVSWAAPAPATPNPPLTTAQRTQAAQLAARMNQLPQPLSNSAQQLYDGVARARGEILVVTGGLPQGLAQALVTAAKGGAKITVLADSKVASGLLPLKRSGVALYRSTVPVRQGMLVHNDVTLTGRLVNTVERTQGAYRSVSMVTTIRTSWRDLIKLGVRL